MLTCRRNIIRCLAAVFGALLLLLGLVVHYENARAAGQDAPGFLLYKAHQMAVEGNSAYEDLLTNNMTAIRYLYDAGMENEAFKNLTVFWTGMQNESFRNNPSYFYEMVITDLLQNQKSLDTEKDHVDQNLKTINAKISTKFGELMGSETMDEIRAESKSIDFFVSLYEDVMTAKEVKDNIEKLKTLKEEGAEQYLIDWASAKVSDITSILDAIVALRSVNEGRIEICKKMKASTDNALMKVALMSLIEQYDTDNDIIVLAAAKYGAQRISTALDNYVQASVTSLLTSMGLSSWAASYKLGTFLGNSIFSTDAISENWLILKSVVEVEDELRKAVKSAQNDFVENETLANARTFLEGCEMLLYCGYYGCDVAENFAYITCKDNVYSFIKEAIGLQDEENPDLAAVQKTLTYNRNWLDSDKKSWDYYYDLYRAMFMPTEAAIRNISEEEQNRILSLPENRRILEEQKNHTVELGSELYYNVTIRGSVLMKSGTLDLKGHTLRITGNLKQTGGTIKVNKGTLLVGGNYDISSSYIDDTTGEEKLTNGGYLEMRSTSDTVTVEGDMRYCVYDSSSYYLSAGTLNLHGDLDVESAGYSSYRFYPSSENFQTIFSQKEVPKVYMDTGSSGFASSVVHFKTGKVRFTGITPSFNLEEDLEIIGSLPRISWAIDLKGHAMTVNEELWQPDGVIRISGGSLHCKKGYDISSTYIDDTTGEEKLTSGGYLEMHSTSDTVTVDGDMRYFVYDSSSNNLSAGTLNLHGDLDVESGGNSSYRFYPTSEKFQTIFSQKEVPTVHMDMESSGFASSVVHFKTGKVRFTGITPSFNLEEDLEIIGSLPRIKRQIDLKGHTMTVNEKLWQPTGTIRVNGGNLYCKKGYDISSTYTDNTTGEEKLTSGGYLEMHNTSDMVTVDGDMRYYVNDSSSNNLSAGTLNLHGDLDVESGGNSSYRFYPTSEKFQTVFSGKAIPEVYMDTAGSGFASSIVHFTTGKVKFTGQTPGMKLQEDLEIVEKPPVMSGKVDPNGYRLTWDGDLTEPYFLNLSAGSVLHVKGNMRLDRDLALGGSNVENGKVTDGRQLLVDGDLTQTEKNISLGKGGILTIGGSFRQYQEELDDMTNETVRKSGGTLTMSNVLDCMTIGGDWITCGTNTLTAGTVVLSGNLIQEGDYNPMNFGQYHTVVLEGGTPEKPQEVHFAYKENKFHNLELKKTRDCYLFDPDNCWDSITYAESGDLKDAEIKLDKEQYVYDGNPVEADPEVMYEGRKLAKDQDYEISYANNGGPGTATLTIREKEGASYTGEKSVEFIIICGHPETTILPYVGSTCTENGWTEGEQCSICQESLKAQEMIPATGHQWDQGKVTKKPTETEAGEMTYTCLNCGTTRTEEIPAAKHVWDKGTVTVEATCTTPGERVYTCKDCGTIKYVEIPALGHDYRATAKGLVRATLKKNGSQTLICSRCGVKGKTTVIYYPKNIQLSATSFVYSGGAKKPAVTVKDAKGKVIPAKTGYTLQYSGARKAVGQYKVTIRFCGNYSGSTAKTFTIVPKGTTLTAATAGKKQMTVKWKKNAAQTTGYEIQYSLNKSFKSGYKTVAVTNNKTLTKKITGLTAKKTYYVRIRTYKTVQGKKYVSAWSGAKAAKIK